MNRGQARPLMRQIKPSQLVIAQRQIPVAPFDIGARTLENLRQRLGLSLAVPLGLRAQVTYSPTRLEQWRAKTDSQCPQ